MRDWLIDLRDGAWYDELGWDATHGVVGRLTSGVIARWAAQITVVPPAPDDQAWAGWALTQARAWEQWLQALHSGETVPHPSAVQLRIWGAQRHLHLALLGSVAGSDGDAVRAAAQHQAQVAHALFPATYGLVPAEDAVAFAALAQDDWLRTQPTDALVGIRRGEWFPVFDQPERVWEHNYSVEPPPWSLHGLTATMRAVYHTAAPVLVAVTATPTTLYPEEERDLAQLYATAQTLAAVPGLRAQLAGRAALRGYATMLARWRRPWRVAVQAAGAVTPLVRAALLADHTPQEDRDPVDECWPRGQPEWVMPRHSDEVTAALAGLCDGQIVPWGQPLAAPRYRRFQELADATAVVHGLRVPPLPAALLAVFNIPVPPTAAQPDPLD